MLGTKTATEWPWPIGQILRTGHSRPAARVKLAGDPDAPATLAGILANQFVVRLLLFPYYFPIDDGHHPIKANTMDELLVRQAVVLRRLVSDYREGVLGLNNLVQRIEAVGEVLGVEPWTDAVFPIVLSMEQVNAAALEAKRVLTEADEASVENSLSELEALIARFESA
ncbi:MAG: hypothetical protein KF778_11400 [Rhodocyclaceae bacterium]|nr:hypothetical protein [Rhodocyclaceae bacterium]